MNHSKFVLSALGFVLLVGLLTACSSPEPSAPEAVENVPEAVENMNEEPSLLAADALSISLEPVGHWHVYNPKTLIFNVIDTESGEGLAGLDLVVQIARAGSDRVTTRSVAEEQVNDEGEGLYSLEYTPTSIGAYGIAAGVLKDGQHFASAPVAVEIARDGEEGVKVEANGSVFVYQIRYNWDPGHIHANDSEPVSLIFEVMRGLQEGDAINWEQPWTNTFDHVTDAEDAVVQIQSADGTVSDEVELNYRGRGIYQAERIFSEAEVGEENSYQIVLTFTDPYSGAEVTHSEPYELHAVEGH